jgi:hypothetical protein
MATTFALVQMVPTGTGGGGGRNFLVPTDRVTPELEALLQRLHGCNEELSLYRCSRQQPTRRDWDAFYSEMRLLGEFESRLVTLPEGASITRVCMVYNECHE